MKPLARRAVASLACAAILAAQWPASAWAGAGVAEPRPSEALAYLHALGVYKDDADPLKTYLGSNSTLTPIGRTLYLSLRTRYNAREDVESMKPALERLRGLGRFSEARQDGAARALKIFESRFGTPAAAPAGSDEESFRFGAMSEALMTGAAIADPPKGSAYSQVRVGDEIQFRDAEGLAYRMTKDRVVFFSRELQENQRKMNQSRPPQVAWIPETGRHNNETLQYSYWRLKNQEQEFIKATRIDRMMAIAELLEKQYPPDVLFNDKTLEADLIRQAKAKTTFSHRGTTYSYFDIVEAKLTQRRAYLEGLKTAVLRFETDMNRFKASSTITDSQVATMSLDEQNALRWVNLTLLEAQMFHVENQRGHVDPTSPDAQAVMKMIDGSDLTPEQKIRYKGQGVLMKDRLDELKKRLEMTRDALYKTDYAGSLDAVSAALTATQKQLGDLSVDYSIYLGVPSTAFLARSQALRSYGGWNPITHLSNGIAATVRGVYKWTPWGAKYEDDMAAIEGDGKAPGMEASFAAIAALIAKGGREDWAQARSLIMEMNPKAAEYAMSGTAAGDPSKVNDALRIGSSLKAANDRITAVTETNKSLDAVTTAVSWTISLALMAPVARASLNLVGKVSGVGVSWINAGLDAGGVRGLAMRALGRSMMIVGESAKHAAARIESIEPDAGRVKAVAGSYGEYAAARYAVASAARAGSVAWRQATFTAMSGGISSAFTFGHHFWEIGTNRIGGVNIGGWQAIEPGHTMFSEDLDGAGKAALMGLKGGLWWANDSLDFGAFKLPTAVLGYIGLPTTAFAGMRVSGFMETIGTRGVVGSALRTLRTWGKTPGTWGMTPSAVEAAEEAAMTAGRKGLLETMSAAKWYTLGPPLAFGLSMADNVAKYTLFSEGAGQLGKLYGWHVSTYDEDDVERRIKAANLKGQAVYASPAWLLIPTYGAHGARDASPYMLAREGMRQYDEVTAEFPTGRTALYANAAVDTPLKISPPKVPLSQALFEKRFLGKAAPSEFIVTKQVKEAGQLKEVKRLSEQGGLVNPIELMAVREMESGKATFRTLHVTEEVQKAAYDVATEGLVAQSKNALEALTVKPGNTVKGWGEITPENQVAIAKALYRAETSLGRKLTPEVSAKVREVLKDHLLANLPIGTAGKVLRAAVIDLPLNAPNLDKAQKEAIEIVLDWEVSPSKDKPSYLELTRSLKKTAEANGELSPKEARALTALYDYIITGDERFNSFNKPEGVKARADVIFDALAIKFAGRAEMMNLVSDYRRKVHGWADGNKAKNLAADGPLVPEEARLEMLVKRLVDALQKEPPGKLAPSESEALENSLKSIGSSAWVVRDAKGGAISGWREKQYVRLMQSFLGEGSQAHFVRSMTDGFFKDMRKEYKGRDKLLTAVDGVEAEVNAWIESHKTAKEEVVSMFGLLEKLKARLEAGALESNDGAALSGLVDEIGGLDRQGLHRGILSSGRRGNVVKLFVKAPTSVGKTLLAYEGLLPYLEAEAAGSGREVMFLTFNTKLQAQAEFDFLAFNKLGSKVKFDTYEGLKTMIADGKSRGRGVVEKYLLLQDEMDAAGQQPALTIGMVSGRVSRLSGQTAAINESNAYIASGMSRLNTIRVESAEVQAQHIKTVTSGLSDAHVKPGRLGDIRTAAEDVLTAVGQLKRAKGAVAVDLAEAAVKSSREKLSGLVEGGGLPASEAEAQTTILAALGRMKEAIDSRPSANPAVRERLAGEMESSFLNQRRLMDLTDTAAGLSRLPAEARKARMALESRIKNLENDLGKAEKSASPKAGGRANLLRDQLEFARVEKAMIERFDGVDASARLIRLDAEIAAIRGGQTPAERLTVNAKLSRLMRESVELEAQGPGSAARRAGVDGRLGRLLKSLGEKSTGASDAAVLKSYRAETGRALGVEREIGETEAAIKAANKFGEPTAALEARLTKLHADRETSLAELRKLETKMGAVESTPKLDALVSEAKSLEAGMTPERRAAHEEYRTLLEREQGLSARMGESDAGGRAAIEAERATVRGRLHAIELDFSAAPAKSYLVGKARRVDLGGALRRIELLSAEAERLERGIKGAEARGENAGELKADLKSARGEEAALRREARTEIMTRFDEVGADIAKLTREGKPGWDARVNRLIEGRRALQEAYAGDESALYGAYREMKESTRPIGADPRLVEKPYEIPGGEGLEPAAALKRADFLIDRARQVEAKAKDGGAGPLERQFLKSRAELEGLAAAKESKEYSAALDRMLTAEGELLRADAYHWAERHLKTIDGDSFLRFLPSLPGLLWQTATGDLPSAATEGMGLTRYHAAKMLRALSKDPMLPSHQRDNLMWSYFNSLLFPTGVGSRGSSYVRNEIVNMVKGFTDSAAGVRVDNRTGRFNVVHNGQWFESMDNASRRWWELEYGTDLTLPYTHNSMSTIKDVTMDKKGYFISLSGTSGKEFESHLHDNKISIVGEGSAMPKNVLLEVVSTPEQRLSRIVDSLKTMETLSQDQVVLRAATDAIPPGAKAAIDEYMGAHGMKRGDPQVIEISEVVGADAQNFLRGMRANQKNTGLTVISISSTREMRKVETRLTDSGVGQDEIAKVFSDTEHLRLNRPEAKVLDQMNIDGLTTGKVKVLLLVAPVAGRGLDLNFKGVRGSTSDKAFRGYTNFNMYVLGPEEISTVHTVQTMGRIDTGRTLGGAPRRFSLLMDIESARAEVEFRDMFKDGDFFIKMRRDPAFLEYARTRRGGLDWTTVNDYVRDRAADGSGEGAILRQDYEKAVREALSRRNLEVERDLLRQSNVLTDKPAGAKATESKHPALDLIR